MLSEVENKLYLIHILFSPNITDRKSNLNIDYERTETNHTRAFEKSTWETIPINNKALFGRRFNNTTKSDLLYMNNVVNRLISILGTDKNKITEDYIMSKLNLMGKYKFKADEVWIGAYCNLLSYIKPNE